jgi:hypothetical protein
MVLLDPPAPAARDELGFCAPWLVARRLQNVEYSVRIVINELYPGESTLCKAR